MLFLYLQMLDSEEERSKFARLYMCYRELMFCAASRLLGNDMDAEDAVHQAFLAILDHFSAVREISSPETKAYVVIITERKAIDILRRQKRLTELGTDIPERTASDPAAKADLADAILSLPRRYREALLLKYLHGYSTAELSSLWGIKKDSVQKILWRAKTALKERLEENADE